jgi:hypothetical protein
MNEQPAMFLDHRLARAVGKTPCLPKNAAESKRIDALLGAASRERVLESVGRQAAAASPTAFFEK